MARHSAAGPGWVLAGRGWARTRPGEFGATLMVAGNIPGRTQTLPLAMYDAVQNRQYGQAHAMVGLIAGGVPQPVGRAEVRESGARRRQEMSQMPESPACRRRRATTDRRHRADCRQFRLAVSLQRGQKFACCSARRASADDDAQHHRPAACTGCRRDLLDGRLSFAEDGPASP